MKRAEIFKELKKRNAYKKEYFKMKVPELKNILEKLDGVSISEPDFGDDEDEPENVIPQPMVPQPEVVPEKIKKIKKEKVAVKQKIVTKEPPVVLEKPKDQNYRKNINTIIKIFEEDLYDLLKHFDDGELTQNDVDMITSEYDVLYDETSDAIEKILDTHDVSDSNYLALIQKKLNINTLKLQKFLEMD
jgi:hypothetical protein